MAVILVAGNQPLLPRGMFEGARTMTTNIVLEMAYASGQHREALIATSAVLFLFILFINACFAYLKGKTFYE
ncbi:phosphate ABC transporter, permease family protein [Streptococcus ictaluri 707-05]|uniref:Phosphate ABC transporter, permease family protein n=1 Tax=Streptococcus ictaluri 707-05 TaxID=764299 RepID=G5K249_9STRE|nr:phosphate ABC transporter, permease family protein [Streptococcus ictaluri 707-05]